MVNIGMVGVGAISGIYLKNITEIFREIKLIAVCDLVKERAQKAKEQYNISKIYDTMYELFDDPEIDIVLNLTRPYEHFEVSKAALLAGKNVYSEKPLAACLEEGTELVKIAEEKKLYLGGAPDTFLGSGIQTCRKIIDSGVIGQVVGVSASMICPGHESWHPDPEFYYKYGGGPMMDMGPYYITAMVNLFGGIKNVTGVAKTSFEKRIITSKPHFGEFIDVEVPTYVTGILQFENNVVGTLFTTFDVPHPSSARFEVYGSLGTLFVPDPNCFGDPIELYMLPEKIKREIPQMFDYAENSRALGLADMAKAIETSRIPRCSYKQTLHVLEVITAFQKSSETQAAVPIKSEYKREAPMNFNSMKGVLD